MLPQSVVVSVGAETRSILRGRAEISGYQFWAEHGFLRGVPGQSECMALWQFDFVPDTVAISSALLVEEVQKRG
jgi:hypothetical protein